MTPEQINELERLYNEATKGPWESEACNSRHSDEAYQALKSPDDKTIADCCNSELIEIHRECDDDELGAVHYWDETGRKNLAFIAAAHAAMPELLRLASVALKLLALCESLDEALSIEDERTTGIHEQMKQIRAVIANTREAQ